MSMPSVPNWIARALIMSTGYNRNHQFIATTGWRATKTQVIVTTKHEERRFRLDTLTEVGDKNYGSKRTRLVSPDDPEVRASLRNRVVSNSLSSVLDAVYHQRLQDSSTSAEDAVRKLTAVQDAVNQALAALAEVL